MHGKRSILGALIFAQGSTFGQGKMPRLDGRTEVETYKINFKHLCVLLCHLLLISAGCSNQRLFSEV